MLSMLTHLRLHMPSLHLLIGPFPINNCCFQHTYAIVQLKMPKNNSNQCPNRCRWFNNSRSLKLHITSCRKKHFGDGGLTKNDNSSPLKSTERNTDLNEYVHKETNDIDVNTIIFTVEISQTRRGSIYTLLTNVIR